MKITIERTGTERGAGLYTVKMGSMKFATIYREYYGAQGNPGYTNHSPGEYLWNVDFEEWVYESGISNRAGRTFESFKEAKAHVLSYDKSSPPMKPGSLHLFNGSINLRKEDFRSKANGYHLDVWQDLKEVLSVEAYADIEELELFIQLKAMTREDGTRITI